MHDVPDLALGYWEHYRRSRSPDRGERAAADDYEWAWEEVDEFVRSQPAAAVAVLVEIAEAAPDEQSLAYLGAGPVEDLLRGDTTDVVIDRIDAAARRSSSFRSALRCAWYDDHVTPEVRDRLRRFGDPH